MAQDDKRLFTAIRCTDEVREVLEKNSLMLEQFGRVRLTRPENFHITLIYVGGTSREQDVRQAMRELACEPFDLEFDAAGWFMRPEGMLVCQGVRVSNELVQVHQQLNDNLCWRGFCSPDLPFTPHITLGRRFRPFKNHRAESVLASLEVPSIMRVDSVSLFESKRVNDVLVYEELERLELQPH